jgi:hypothetical protein
VSELALPESPALRNDFPGLSRALDTAIALNYLQDALFGAGHQRYAIVDCELKAAHCLPGNCCILSYRLTIEDKSSGGEWISVVTGRVFPHAPACVACVRRLLPRIPPLQGRTEILPFVNPVAVIEPLHMAVYVFPIDGDLPGLAAASDPGQMVNIFNETLPGLHAEGPVETCRIELVVYRRQDRAVLRYFPGRLSAGAGSCRHSVVYGKLNADSSGAMARTITSALRQHLRENAGAYKFAVPEVLAWLPDLRLSLLASVPGDGGIHRALKARLRAKPARDGELSPEEMVDACGRIAATIHGSDLRTGTSRTFGDELLWLNLRVSEMRRVSPELALLFQPWLRKLSDCSGHPPLAGRTCHGDFTPGQMLFGRGNAGLVDFDSVCQAEPALDLGQFLAYLRIACMKAAPAAAQGSDLADRLDIRFLAAYAAASRNLFVDPVHLARRVDAYRKLSLLRCAVHSWQKFKPGRAHAAFDALSRCL